MLAFILRSAALMKMYVWSGKFTPSKVPWELSHTLGPLVTGMDCILVKVMVSQPLLTHFSLPLAEWWPGIIRQDANSCLEAGDLTCLSTQVAEGPSSALSNRQKKCIFAQLGSGKK